MKKTFLLTVLSVILLISFGCAPEEPLNVAGTSFTCEGCHTNETLLKELAPEGEAAPSGGG